MNSPAPSVVVFGTAAVVSAAGAGMESAEIQYGAEVVAMLALSAGAALTGRHRALRLFGLLLAGAALADLAASWLFYPDPAPRGPNGCPITDEAVTRYWTDQLRLAQLAAALRFGALICVTLTLSALPQRPGLRPWHRPMLITLASIPAILIGLHPIYSANDHAELLHPTMPATLTLSAAVWLTMLTLTRTAGGQARTTALVGGGVLSLVAALLAVEKLATPIVQLRYLSRDPEPGVFVRCAYSYGTPVTSLSTVALTVGGILLSLAAPALLVWASSRPSR
ncbi:hypothetical protein QLQ12_46030 [Actinoplanes sp. NEAU-A12]|uniref:Uncharacterized protein n=1 Tax=Actinoplanes sandaracinus TaxID=3045177 RepID=A0ABT6X1T3_9ACTN|nr:hypothetical protein [Actinoplanes sandaracinus]MDI6105954.1 hypothetical protein [Actinoplanes sandaracinus]